MAEKMVRFDGHCHFFNAWYLIKELAAIGWDCFWGNYPRKVGVAGALGAGKQQTVIDFIGMLLRQIAQVMQVLVKSYDGNYELLYKNFKAVYGQDAELRAIPLMMDIYFMFAPPASGGGLKVAEPLVPIGKDPEKEYHEWFDQMKEMIIAEATQGAARSGGAYRGALLAEEATLLSTQLDDIYAEITSLPLHGALGAGSEILMTPGFESEVRHCLDFQAKHRDQVFPFLAVDPRRTNIMNLIQNGAQFGVKGPLVSPKGPFFGIKLYPRLGYLPADLDSIRLFEWCTETDTPITVHTSPGGFPSLHDWKWDDNSNPAHWDEILKKYKSKGAGTGLRVDFAHFGGTKQAWRTKILSYINGGAEYGKNIYTDIACFTTTEKLEDAKKAYDAAANKALKGKLIFGTDYDVMLLTDFIDLQVYFRKYKDIFEDGQPPSYSEELMVQAPRTFLKLAGGTASGGKPTTSKEKDEGGNGGEGRKNGIPLRNPLHARYSFREALGKELALGWRRDLPDVRDYTIFKDTVPAKQKQFNVNRPISKLAYPIFRRFRGNLPTKVDLRRWCSVVENQKTLGSCTANAVVGMVEYFENRAMHKYIDASRLFLYKVTRKLLGWQGDSGAYLRTTLESMVLFGVPPESYYPYEISEFDEEPSPFAYAFAQNYKTLSFYRFDPAGTSPQELVSTVKTALAAGFPAAFGFTVYDSMGEAKENGRVPFPSSNNKAMGGHAVLAVGYDEDMEILNGDPGSTPTRGAILFRNSWGNWGEDGYGWLPFEYILQGLAVDWWSIIKQDWVDTGAFD